VLSKQSANAVIDNLGHHCIARTARFPDRSAALRLAPHMPPCVVGKQAGKKARWQFLTVCPTLSAVKLLQLY
jgi:hypothetical protein